VEPKIPSVMIWLGAVSEADAQAARAAGRTLPALHSSAFRPDPDPAIATGVRLMTDAALDLLKARR
jgi:hippurate hydrolase